MVSPDERLTDTLVTTFDAPVWVFLNELKRRVTEMGFERITYLDEEVKFYHLDDEEPLKLVKVATDEVVPFKSYMEFMGISQIPRTIRTALTSDEEQAVAASFSAHLTYSGMVQSTMIIEYICRCADLTGNTGSTIYAPYGTLFQSSGFGKSRGVCEVGRRLSTIYGVFRKNSDTGYPRQTHWLTLLCNFVDIAPEIDLPRQGGFTISQYKVGRVLLFFHCLLKAYNQLFKEFITDNDFRITCFPETASDPVILTDEQVSVLCTVYHRMNVAFSTGNADISRFNEFLQTNLNSTPLLSLTADILYNSIGGEAAKFRALNEYVYKRRNLTDQAEWAGFVNTYFRGEEDRENHRIWPKDEQESYPFVVVLDEASILNEVAPPGGTSILTVIRRALHFIPPNSNFMMISLGTSCDVSTLNRPIRDDSLRFRTRRNLLFPMIVTGNWDIHRTEMELQNLVVDANFVKNRRTLLLKASFGRPVWNSLNLKHVISTALTKLKNGCTDPYTPSIATWCIRVGLTVNASSKLAETLLKSHMATLLAVSSEADQVLVNYSAEPVLAIAAREFLAESRSSVYDYFKSLLQFVEGVPTDRGKMGESVFSEILLQAMDRSVKLTPTDSRTVPGASSRVAQILGTRNFLLEEFPPQPVNEPIVTTPASDLFCRQHFRASTVGAFLKSLYSVDVYNSLAPFLPKPLLDGTLNFAQFITLQRNFPELMFFKNSSRDGLADASGEYNKKCNMFDSAMMKLGLLKDVAYLCPFGYYGLDAVIPVLIEVDVEVEINSVTGHETVLRLVGSTVIPQARTASGRRIQIRKRKRSVQTYIGLQYKVGHAEKLETLSKVDPILHMNAQGCTDWEKEAIRKYHLVLVLSSENDAEKTKLTRRSPQITPPFSINHWSSSSTEVRPLNALKQSFYSLPNSRRLGLDSMTYIRSPRFPEGVPQPVSFSSVKVSPHVSVCGVAWSPEKKVTCIWSSSLMAFSPLLKVGVLDLAHEIIRGDRPVFTKQYDKFVLRSMADAVLNTQTAFYPNSDPLLRSFRGHSKIRTVLKDFSHWNLNLSVVNKRPSSRTVENELPIPRTRHVVNERRPRLVETERPRRRRRLN